MEAITIEQAQEMLKVQKDSDMYSKCKELGISLKWAELFILIDRSYEEVYLWSNGDFGLDETK